MFVIILQVRLGGSVLNTATTSVNSLTTLTVCGIAVGTHSTDTAVLRELMGRCSAKTRKARTMLNKYIAKVNP